LDIGFLESGFDIVWHNEYHMPFVTLFEYGMKSMGYKGKKCKIQNTNSILRLSTQQIQLEAFGNNPKPDIFGIIGGPPCPDFSVAGKNLGGLGNNGKLLKVYLEKIKELQPTFFILENVPGLVRTLKHRQYLADSISPLTELYSIDLKILNALNFGVPQDRNRVFIVGIKKTWLKQNRDDLYHRFENSPLNCSSPKEHILKEIAYHAYNHWYIWPENNRYKNIRDNVNWHQEPVPKGSIPIKPNIPDELMVYKYICDDNLINIPNGNEYFVPRSTMFSNVLEGDVSKKSFKRLHRYRYSPAAAYGNNEVHLHCCHPRRLSVREALRIQSIPDSYIMSEEVPLTHKFKAIGNGVPAMLAKAVAHSLKQTMSWRDNERI